MASAGCFIDPDPTLADHPNPAAMLGIPINSGYQAIKMATRYRRRSRIFDAICGRIETLDIPYEDQCSGKYYFDLVNKLRDFNGEFDRVVEVGVFMGGASTILAGCSGRFDFDLDLVDIGADYLRFSHERIRRSFPEAVGRIRLFHGDLPSYVETVMLREGRGRAIVHHDGAHDFNQVVRDMASLSFVAHKLHAIIAQDTHLRGSPEYMNFVDMALYAVFGLDLNYEPIGSVYPEGDMRTLPNQYEGNYFVADAHEGFVLPMSMNRFRYPHPSMVAEQFLKAA